MNMPEINLSQAQGQVVGQTQSPSADASLAGRDHRRQAWQRELEQALAQSWFHANRPATPHSGDVAQPLLAIQAQAVRGENSVADFNANPGSRIGTHVQVDATRAGEAGKYAEVRDKPATSIAATDAASSSMVQAPGVSLRTEPVGNMSLAVKSDAPQARAGAEAAIRFESPMQSSALSLNAPGDCQDGSGTGMATPAALASASASSLSMTSAPSSAFSSALSSAPGIEASGLPFRVEAALAQAMSRAFVAAPASSLPVGSASSVTPQALPSGLAAEAETDATASTKTTATTDAHAPASAQRLARPGTGNSDDANPMPVRLHVQWNASRADVWMGVDVSAQAWLPQLASTLQQWMRAQGVHINRLVCNGRLVTSSASATTASAFTTHFNLEESHHGQHRSHQSNG